MLHNALASLLCLFVFSAASALGQTYSFGPLAGNSSSFPGSTYGIANAPRFEALQIATGPNGDVYFADADSHVVYRVTAAGILSVFAGSPGNSGFANGAGTSARFTNPNGIAVDAAGNVYVGDGGNYLLRKIDPSGNVSTFAGQVGVKGNLDGTGTGAQFGGLSSLALDAAGNLYVLDTATSSAFFYTIVRKVTPAGVVTTLLGPTTESIGTTTAPFGSGRALAVDRSGNVLIADTGTNTIRKVTPAGVLSTFAGSPYTGGSADGIGAAASFRGPSGIAIDAAGNAFVTDRNNGTLRRIAPDGTVTTIAGQPDADRLELVDGAGGAARFRYPEGVATDASGNVFVLDAYGLVVRKGVPVTAATTPVATDTPAMRWGYGRNVGARSAVTFTAAAAGAAPIGFQWLKNGSPIAGATGATFTIPSASETDEARYAVTVSNSGGSYTSRAVPLSVFTPAFDAFTSRRTVAGGSFLWSIATDNRQLVTVGSGGKILTSADGVTWTTRDSGTTDWLVGVTYGGGKFVAVGDRGTILVSPDAVTWTRAASSGTAQRLNNVVFGANRFVAVGEGGAIVVSADAQTWTAQSSGVTGWLRGLVYVPPVPLNPGIFGENGTGLFYASGQNGELLEGSGEGTWHRSFRYDPAKLGNRDVEALAGGPIGIGQDGAAIAQSSYILYAKFGGGTSSRYWNYHDLGLTARFRGLARGADAIFATGENGVIAAAQDISGPWSFIPSGTNANLVAGVFRGNSLYIVGENETILQSQPLYVSRLMNISARSQVGPVGNPMISGFVIAGTAKKTVLLRAAGPTLRDFNLTGVLGEPVLTLFDGARRPIASNARWGTADNAAAIADAIVRVGAFSFPTGSNDSALLVTLDPGSYTAQVSGAGLGSGLALVEAYDAEPLATEGSRVINMSALGQAGLDDKRLIAGFVVSGAASRRVLIRAIGPTLTQYGVSGVLNEPQLEIYNNRGTLLQRAGAWSAQAGADELRGAAAIVGAFALPADSRDAATLMTLVPGSYTVQVSGMNNTTGIALVEIYDLP